MRAFTIPSIFTAIDKLSGPLRKMTTATNIFAATAQRNLRMVQNSADGMFNKLTGGRAGVAMAGLFGLGALAARKFVTEASRVEDATARFTPLLGSVDKATEFVKMLNKEAASTPFQFSEIADSAGMLLPGMNGNLQETVRIWRMLGDTSGGNAQKMDSIVRGYNKSLLKGKVDMESLNMIAEAGVPIHQALAKQLGFGEKNMSKYFKSISSGKIGTDALTKALETMTGKGGMFFNGMATSSQTFTGKFSSMLDNLNLAAGAIGDAILPILKQYTDKVASLGEKIMNWAEANKDLIKTKIETFVAKLAEGLQWLYDNFDTILKVTKVYVGMLVALKTVSLVSAIATNSMAVASFIYSIAMGLAGAITGKASIAIGKNVVAMNAYKAAVGIGTAAQWLWNQAMTANPIGLIIVGIAALIALVATVVSYWDDWGAAVSVLMGPLGFVISLIEAFRRNWDMITEAFSKGGIIAGIKAIGATVLDAILMPLHQVAKIIANITGAKWAKTLDTSMAEFRKGLGVQVSTAEKDAKTETPVVNSKATQQEAQYQLMEKVNNASVTVGLSDGLKVKEKAGTVNIMPVLGSTLSNR